MITADDALGRALLTTARNAIAREIGAPAGDDPELDDELRDQLNTDGATFVTLTMNNRLRGCIGSLIAHRPLRVDVAENAVAAATRDPRFMPISASELNAISLSVSLLTAPEHLDYDGTEAGAIAAVRPGVDGIVMRHGNHRATFLPQVWDDLPDPAGFLQHLRAKAGIDAFSWPDGITLERYEVHQWADA